jgi:glycosyltransferase involved in cell wall biosynthesis
MNIEKKVIIGTIGALDVKYKGQERIIKAISILNRNGYNFEYQLVGGGNEMRLKKIAQKYNVLDNVKFLGTLPHNDVFEWFQNIDIYAQPSTTEGLPRAMIEAMSCGLTCIGAKTGGIPELLDSEYIFSNKINSIHEIVKILSSITKEKLLLQAKRNFQEASNYTAEILEKRRSAFLSDYKQMIDHE